MKQFDTIRTTVPLDGPDVFDDARTHHLPAGTQGTIVEVWRGGEEYEIEFVVGDPVSNFRSVMMPVPASAVEADR